MSDNKKKLASINKSTYSTSEIQEAVKCLKVNKFPSKAMQKKFECFSVQNDKLTFDNRELLSEDDVETANILEKELNALQPITKGRYISAMKAKYCGLSQQYLKDMYEALGFIRSISRQSRSL